MILLRHWGAPVIPAENLERLGGPETGDPHATIAVLGPGTGFGVSALVRDAHGKEMAMPSEGGHACFPPGDPVEDEILRILRRRYDRVSIERLICGPGLLNMHRALAEIDGRKGPRIGVYVRDLDTGESAGWRTDERWYLASTVKVPIAIAVMRGVERGAWTLDTPVILHAGDYVDGAGSTNRQPVGAQIPVRKLMEQMIIYSDNTASDL